MKKSINIWMQLLGFEKNDKDRGAARFLSQCGFLPDSVCALFFHPDFIHLHSGMKKEYHLFPDNCAYRAIPRNTERARQDWTNYDLRTLIAALKKQGVEFYAGIMGTYLSDMFHDEWLTDYPELRATSIRGPRNLMCLKRFADGKYYEDFFAKKVVQVLTDYDLAGIHLSDGFCPSDHLYKSDYSTDMVEQFTAHTGLTLPPAVAQTMGDDSPEAAKARQSYLWGEKRAEWIAFYEWRWERFFKKLCDACHAAGKKVWVLGMYCTDPFETRYIYGFDTKRVMDAGVDAITANILPSSVYLEAPEYPYYFHRMHLDLPLLRAQVGEHTVLSMVGVQDASEEWSVLAHTPTRLERDIYTMTAFSGGGRSGNHAAADGLFLCLGDGISRKDWDYLHERIQIGFSTDVQRSHSPMLLWSDTAADKMLAEYMATRRTTPHKQGFEVFRAGTPLGGAVRSELLDKLCCPLFVPNYDMLSDEERKMLAAYPHPWVGTAPASYPLLELSPTYVCQDWYSDLPLKAFVCGAELDSAQRAEIDELLSLEDHTPSRAAEPEKEVHPPIAELPFAKLTDGFVRAVCILLQSCTYKVFSVSCDRPMLAVRLKNGKDRLFLFNPHSNGYVNAKLTSHRALKGAEVVSSYPVLPVKFFHEEAHESVYDFEESDTPKHKFKVKLSPDGVTVVDIRREPHSPPPERSKK